MGTSSYCMMARKKGTALQRVRNLIVQEPAAVPEPTGDENPDLDAVSSHSSDSTPSREDSYDPTTAARDQAPLEAEAEHVRVGEPLVRVGARRQRAESGNGEADDAASPATKRRKAYLPEVCLT